MVTIKNIQSYGFETIEDYYWYILQSKVNGQHKQARELFSNLSEGMQGQRAGFFNWLETESMLEQDELTATITYFKPTNKN